MQLKNAAKLYNNNNNFISRGHLFLHSSQSSIWSSINKCWHDFIKMNRHTCTIIYSLYSVNVLRTPNRLRADYQTLLQWRGRYDFSRLKTNQLIPCTYKLVMECFLTRSMLFLKCICTLFTVILSSAQYQKRYFKLITHCFLLSPPMC